MDSQKFKEGTTKKSSAEEHEIKAQLTALVLNKETCAKKLKLPKNEDTEHVMEDMGDLACFEQQHDPELGVPHLNVSGAVTELNQLMASLQLIPTDKNLSEKRYVLVPGTPKKTKKNKIHKRPGNK